MECHSSNQRTPRQTALNDWLIATLSELLVNQPEFFYDWPFDARAKLRLGN